MKSIKYIVSYDIESNFKENRVNVLASSNKINYIVSVLNDLGYKVDLISTSQTLNSRCYLGKEISLGINKLHLFPTTWRGGVILKCINVLVMRWNIWRYLKKNVSLGEKIIIYHSIGNLWALRYLKKIKKAYIIEEVEEIYGEIFENKRLVIKEKKELQLADAYMFPTILLDEFINKTNKPKIIVHGAYRKSDFLKKGLEDNKNNEIGIFEENKFHVGYTGIIDSQKGSHLIVKAAQYLDENYHIHILGFGTQKEIDSLNACIIETKNKTNCIISFDGIRRGVVYEEYLKKLNVGICPVDSDKKFILTQFPSKIISYMINNLPVLCSDIQTVKTSDVAKGVFFYQGNSPIDIANAIINIKNQIGYYNVQELIFECDKKFIKEFRTLLQEGK